MSPNIQDPLKLLTREHRARLSLEMRQIERLKAMKMENEDYGAALSLLEFIGSKPDSIALSGEIISFLKKEPYNFTPKHVANLLKYLRQNELIRIGGTVKRHHVLGILPIRLVDIHPGT